MRGDRMDDTGKYKGHGWVVDGYLKHKITVKEWTLLDIPDAEWELINVFEPYYSEYYHMNWGWNGNCNGYFSPGVFATNKAVEYDNPNSPYSNTTNQDYKYNVR